MGLRFFLNFILDYLHWWYATCTTFFVFLCIMRNIPQHLNCGCCEDWNWVRRLQSVRDPLPRASIENPNTWRFFFSPGGREIYEFEKTYGSKGKASAERRGCLCDVCSHYRCMKGYNTRKQTNVYTYDFLHPHLSRFRGERAVTENRQYWYDSMVHERVTHALRHTYTKVLLHTLT